MSLKRKDQSASGGLRVAANDPHLVSLGGGRLSTAVTIHYLPIGYVTIGSSSNCNISLNGNGVQPLHCTIYRAEHEKVKIIPEKDARVLIDGNKITTETNITQGAMLTIGNSNYLRFNNPAEAQMIKSTMGSNERISMPQIDFTQDDSQSITNNSSNKNRILNEVSKNISKSFDSHCDKSKTSNQTILEKIAHVEYANINNFHSPKVFTADSVTVNASAKDVLGPKYANFAKNLIVNHKNEKNFCTKEMNFNISNNSNKPGNYVNVTPINYIQNSPMTVNNDMLAKVNNNNVLYTSPQRHQQMISAAYDRYPKLDGGLQLFPMNGVNSEINIERSEHLSKSEPRRYTGVKQSSPNGYHEGDMFTIQTLTAQEQEKIDEILTICTEYERQQNLSVQSSPIVQNRIKTNGSLPRDKKSPFFDLNSQISPHSKSFTFATVSVMDSGDKTKTTSSSGYENVRIDDRRIDIGSTNFPYKSSNSHENLMMAKCIPQSPRTKIRTTCTSPQKTDISQFSSFTPQNCYQQVYLNINKPPNKYAAPMIRAFDGKLKLEMKVAEEDSNDRNKQALSSSTAAPLCAGDLLRKRQNLNIKNLALNLSSNIDENCSNNESQIKNFTTAAKKTDEEVRNKNGDENLNRLDDLRKERENILNRIRKLKTQISDIKLQEDEVLREMDIEKALVSAEISTVNTSITDMEINFKALQSKIQKMEAQRNANRVMQETLQAKLKQLIEIKQEQVATLKKMVEDNESDESLKEEYKKTLESLENDRKTFEDLEFQYLEEETDWMAYREELHTDLKNLTKEMEMKQLQMLNLQTQGIQNQNLACMDTKSLESNLLSLLKEFERSREKLQNIDRIIFDLTGERKRINYESESDDDEEDIELNTSKGNNLMLQSLFGSTEILSAKPKESINLMSRSINENMFFDNVIEMPIQNSNNCPSIIIPHEVTEKINSNNSNNENLSLDKECNSKKPKVREIEMIPEIVRREQNDEKDPILKLKYNVNLQQNDDSQKCNLNLSLQNDDFEVNPLDKRVASQDDIDRICKVTSDAPISTIKGASSKIIESIKEIERNRQLLLAQQGLHVIEHERQKMVELKKKSHDEARAQYMSSQNIKQSSDEKSNIDDTLNNKSNNDNETLEEVTTPLIKLEISQQELDNKSSQRHSHPEVTRPLCDLNSEINCEKLKEKQFKSNNDLTNSMVAIATGLDRFSKNSDDAKRSSFNSNSTLDDDRLCNIQNNKRVLHKHQRPLTRYLPIMSPDLDLRQHIESAGHQVALCPHVIIDSYSCRGYLHKLGAKFHGWSRRWFVLDRQKNALIYYSDRSERKPRGGAYFLTIDEVYLDHLNTSKSGRPHCTFIVKTKRRSYHLQAASDAAARIWIDAIITGAQGNIDY